MAKNWPDRDRDFKALKAAFDRLYDLVQSVGAMIPDLCRCGLHFNDYSQPCKGVTTCGERSMKRRIDDALKSP
jgi:hypothetical protein